MPTAPTIAAGPMAREILNFIVSAEWRRRRLGFYYPSLSVSLAALSHRLQTRAK